MKIMIDSPVKWDGTGHRIEQIFKRIAKNHEIIKLEPTKGKQRIKQKKTKKENITTYTKILSTKKAPQIIWEKIQEKQKQKIIKEEKPEKYVYMIPLDNYKTITKNYPMQTIYDIADYNQGFHKNYKKQNKIAEETCIKKSDKIISINENLAKKARKHNRKVTIIPNGADLKYLRKVKKRLYNKRKITIGFVGYLSEWVDTRTIEYIAEQLPNCQITIIGKGRKIKQMPNIKQKGHLKYEKVKEEINKFDIGIIPFNNTKIAIHSLPLKFYEYAALNKPIVTSNIIALQKYENKGVHIYKTKQEIIPKIAEAIYGKEQENNWIKKYDWKNLAKKYEKEIKK